jgi:hypothetical protein
MGVLDGILATGTGRAQENHGHLFVPPAYYQVTGDAEAQINADNDWFLFGWVQECDDWLASFSLYITAYVSGDGLLAELFEADSAGEPTGSQMGDDIAIVTGSSADVWVRSSWTATSSHALLRGKRYCLVFRRAASDDEDVSLSYRRENTAQGSMFPDACWSKETTDGGSTWTDLEQDSVPALLNVILNSQADDVPQLKFGRESGQYVYIPGVGSMLIPEEAISLDCSALTAATEYFVYLYNDSGTLTLEASETGWTISEGLGVKTGATSRLLLGILYPIDVLGTGDQAPVDVMDRRLLAYHGMRKTIGKLNPYTAETSYTSTFTGWKTWMDNDDWKIEWVNIGGATFEVSLSHQNGSPWQGYGIAIDSATELHRNSSQSYTYQSHSENSAFLVCKLAPGYHYSYPLMRTGSQPTPYFRFLTDTVRKASFMGTLRC